MIMFIEQLENWSSNNWCCIMTMLQHILHSLSIILWQTWLHYAPLTTSGNLTQHAKYTKRATCHSERTISVAIPKLAGEQADHFGDNFN
jgi:hypothetical protein